MSTYSFNPSIPAANNDPADDQPEMQTNFSSISSLISEDHVGFNTASGGLHTRVRFPDVQSSDPTTTGTASAVYPKSVTGVAQLYFSNSNGVQQLTNLAPTNTDGQKYAASYADGLKIRFGRVSVSSGTTAVSYGSAFTSTCYAVVASPVGAAAGTAQSTPWNLSGTSSASGFSITTTGSGFFEYFAIGN